MEKSLSYGELVELEQGFDNLVKDKGITFGDEEERIEALTNFQSQYAESEDFGDVQEYLDYCENNTDDRLVLSGCIEK